VGLRGDGIFGQAAARVDFFIDPIKVLFAEMTFTSDNCGINFAPPVVGHLMGYLAYVTPPVVGHLMGYLAYVTPPR
jgi:hypothetical protein